MDFLTRISVLNTTSSVSLVTRHPKAVMLTSQPHNLCTHTDSTETLCILQTFLKDPAYFSRYSNWLRARCLWDRIPVAGEIFRTLPVWLWCPPKRLCKGLWPFPGSKEAGTWRRRKWKRSCLLLHFFWDFNACSRGKIHLFLKPEVQWTSKRNGFHKWRRWTKHKIKLKINKFIFVHLQTNCRRVCMS